MARRILILGPSGSGKSTLAGKRAASLDVPVFHLDQVFWQPGWVQAGDDEFAAQVATQAALSAWGIEGNYRHNSAPPGAGRDGDLFGRADLALLCSGFA